MATKNDRKLIVGKNPAGSRAYYGVRLGRRTRSTIVRILDSVIDPQPIQRRVDPNYTEADLMRDAWQITGDSIRAALDDAARG